MKKQVQPGSIRNTNGSLSIWRVPNYLLEARGSFLGKNDKTIRKLTKVRSIIGVLILAGIAIAYPGYASSQPKQVTASARTPAGVVTAANYAAIWFSSILQAIAIALLCIIIFMALMVVCARPGVRLVVLRRLCWAPVSYGLFVCLVVVTGGTVELLNTKGSAWARHQPSDVHYASVVAIFILSLIMAVWAFKSIYLAAVYMFRADDAHPLLAPIATTIISWALAWPLLTSGGPPGVPHDVGILMGYLGPATVTIINILACIRLQREYHTLLFRNGPPGLLTR